MFFKGESRMSGTQSIDLFLTFIFSLGKKMKTLTVLGVIWGLFWDIGH